MKRKKIIPLVSIVILIVLIVVGGTTLFIFKTRDKEKVQTLKLMNVHLLKIIILIFMRLLLLQKMKNKL